MYRRLREVTMLVSWEYTQLKMSRNLTIVVAICSHGQHVGSIFESKYAEFNNYG
jgi:hypothetical protein